MNTPDTISFDVERIDDKTREYISTPYTVDKLLAPAIWTQMIKLGRCVILHETNGTRTAYEKDGRRKLKYSNFDGERCKEIIKHFPWENV